MKVFISALITSMLLTTVPALADTPETRPQAMSIQGSPFDNETGEFQETDVFAPSNSFNNETTFDALLIVVEVAGPPSGRYYAPKDKKYSVQITGVSIESRKRLFKLRSLNLEGKRYVSFLVYDTQCEGVTVTAQVQGPGVGKPIEGYASFHCGE